MSIFYKRLEKGLAAVLVAIFMLGCLTGCESSAAHSADVQQLAATTTENDDHIFVLVDKNEGFKVYASTQTRIMIAVSWGGYSYGQVTQLYGPDGKPMIYEGEFPTE